MSASRPTKNRARRKDVVRTFAERWDDKLDHPEPVVEVIPEGAFLDRCAEVLVGGRQHPDIDAPLLVFADPADLPFLEDAQQLDLHRGRHFSDLVEEDRPAFGLLEQTLAIADGAGKRTGLVPEELAFEQRLGHRPTVHRHEPFPGAFRVLVDVAGENLLADSGLSGQKHRRVEAGDLPGHAQNLSDTPCS